MREEDFKNWMSMARRHENPEDRKWPDKTVADRLTCIKRLEAQVGDLDNHNIEALLALHDTLKSKPHLLDSTSKTDIKGLANRHREALRDYMIYRMTTEIEKWQMYFWEYLLLYKHGQSNIGLSQLP